MLKSKPESAPGEGKEEVVNTTKAKLAALATDQMKGVSESNEVNKASETRELSGAFVDKAIKESGVLETARRYFNEVLRTDFIGSHCEDFILSVSPQKSGENGPKVKISFSYREKEYEVVFNYKNGGINFEKTGIDKEFQVIANEEMKNLSPALQSMIEMLNS